ncbi:MAG: hypothetical protein R6T85_05450 [Egibacteraceae bacterium]
MGARRLLPGSSVIVGMGQACVLDVDVPLAAAVLGAAVCTVLACTGRGGMLRSRAPAACGRALG